MKLPIHQSIHIGLIFLTIWFVVLFLKNPSFLLEIYEHGGFITKAVSNIPFIKLTEYFKSSSPSMTAYLVFLYLTFGMFYLNLYFASSPFGKYVLVHQPSDEKNAAYYMMMAINVYGHCSPYLGFITEKERKEFMAEPEKMMSTKFEDYLANQFDEDKLKKPFLVMSIFGYVVLPLAVYFYLYIEQISHGRYAFWYLAIIMIFLQIRVLADTLIVFRAITME